MQQFRIGFLLCCGTIIGLLSPGPLGAASVPAELRVGTAGHAFDHIGTLGEQAEAAVASGANILYVSGVGGFGYQGLPPAAELAKQRDASAAYLLKAKRLGVRLAIGYVCATSIVNLDAFDRNWSTEFRARFRAPPSAWRQQDRNGKPLASWYGGQYNPACMNNADWRAYEKFMVGQQLAAGCDGIFFDNPTVHPEGCYCPDCMEKFARFVEHQGQLTNHSVGGLRQFAVDHPALFLQFRGQTARDFLAEMRTYARNQKRGALVTANNSLNSWDALYSQCRTYAYNIYEMSKAEDFVVAEDMSSQPRMLGNGQTIEYGPTYKQLRAISHGKPVVAVTIAEGDYHTPANLTRLAMAEAAANGASYLSWPIWPEPERSQMVASLRPQAQLLREHADLLNDTEPRRDVLLFLPFLNWLKTAQCQPSVLAAALSRANIQYEVLCEDDLRWKHLRGTQVLVAASRSDFSAREAKEVERFRHAGGVVVSDGTNWVAEVKAVLTRPSVEVHGSASVRATVADQPHRTLVHVLNLNVQRLSTSQDKVTPARELRLVVRVPLREVRSVRALTADPEGTSGPLKFALTRQGRDWLVETWLPRLDLAALVLIE